ncbi:MAG: hypothetical protein US66_C0004G0001, partial [Candidatus Moranbacteria bacterium GW2011_GWD2_37_9]
MTDNKKERERSSEKGRVVSSSKKRRPDGSSAKSRKGGRRKTDGRTMPSRVGQMVSHEGAARRKTQAAPAVIENKLRIIPLGGQ